MISAHQSYDVISHITAIITIIVIIMTLLLLLPLGTSSVFSALSLTLQNSCYSCMYTGKQYSNLACPEAGAYGGTGDSMAGQVGHKEGRCYWEF